MSKVTIFPQDRRRQLKISAFSAADRQRVLEELDRMLDEREVEFSVCIPYSMGRLVSMLRENGKVLEEEYREEGTWLRVRTQKQYQSMVKEYLL